MNIAVIGGGAAGLTAAGSAKGANVVLFEHTEKIGKKIREATMEKVPYMLVLGDRDMENDTVSVRHRSGEDLGAMSLDQFAAMLKNEVDSMEIK